MGTGRRAYVARDFNLPLILHLILPLILPLPLHLHHRILPQTFSPQTPRSRPRRPRRQEGNSSPTIPIHPYREFVPAPTHLLYKGQLSLSLSLPLSFCSLIPIPRHVPSHRLGATYAEECHNVDLRHPCVRPLVFLGYVALLSQHGTSQ